MESIYGGLAVIGLACYLWSLEYRRKPRPQVAGFALQVAIAHVLSAFLVAAAYLAVVPFVFWLVCGDSTTLWKPRRSLVWCVLFIAPLFGLLLGYALRKDRSGTGSATGWSHNVEKAAEQSLGDEKNSAP